MPRLLGDPAITEIPGRRDSCGVSSAMISCWLRPRSAQFASRTMTKALELDPVPMIDCTADTSPLAT